MVSYCQSGPQKKLEPYRVGPAILQHLPLGAGMKTANAKKDKGFGFLMKQEDKSKPAQLINLVDYQKGSIVSREIIKKETGTVTLFAFDKGQGLSEHTAPFDALVYLLDGQAQVTISGKPLHLKTGEMVIMPAHKPHALKAIEKFKMALTMIRSKDF